MDPGGCPICARPAGAHQSEDLVPGYADSPDGKADAADQAFWDRAGGSDIQPDPYLDPIAAEVDPPEYDPGARCPDCGHLRDPDCGCSCIGPGTCGGGTDGAERDRTGREA